MGLKTKNHVEWKRNLNGSGKRGELFRMEYAHTRHEGSVMAVMAIHGHRICRRYWIYFLLAFIVMVIQLILAICLYNSGSIQSAHNQHHHQHTINDRQTLRHQVRKR